MKKRLQFTSFHVNGLRRQKDIKVDIKDNTLILVGENGSGKTTFLRIMFYFLSGRWSSLAQFEFSNIHARIGDDEYVLEYKDLPSTNHLFDTKRLGWLPLSQRRRLMEMVDAGRIDEAGEYLSHFSRKMGYPVEQLTLPLDKTSPAAGKLAKLQEKLNSTLGAQILYLPTYRRIERELSSIFQGLEPDDRRRALPTPRQSEDAPDFIELVEFGMNDVKAAVDAALEDIRDFQLARMTRLSHNYLADVISRKYAKPAEDEMLNASKETIEAVIDRVDNTILSIYDKSHLREMLMKKANSGPLSEHESIIYHYFTKLVEFQKELEHKEKSIRNFCNICSQYISDKRFVYESEKFSFTIRPMPDRGPKDIKLSDLSSGEKQIVSLFSHLYLSGRENFFVLIDEPELSLSVPWQRRFLLDIRKAAFCSGLIAVTHSPFIYDNELRRNAHGLGEFVSGADWGNIQ